jgi:hypothetical protein
MTQAAQLAQYGANNVGLAFKNRIINGDMRIDQRNNGSSVNLTGNIYTIDRWNTQQPAQNIATQRNAGSVTPPAGFTNYLGFTVALAATPISTNIFQAAQSIEGFNVADLGWGTASASPVTVSFWVRSSLTGTFSGSLSNDSNARSYPFTFVINAANTWEYKTITVAGDTTGTWLTNNGAGIKLGFSLGMGSTYSGTANTWQAGTFLSATGATNLVTTLGATFYITGVQLEKGTVATSFDYRPYGTELALCYRYYQQYSGNQKMLGHGYMFNSTNMYRWGFPLNIEMRSSPTVAFNGDIRAWGGNGPVVASATSTVGSSYTQTNFVDVDIGCAGVSTTAGLVGKLIINSSTASISLSAEL